MPLKQLKTRILGETLSDNLTNRFSWFSNILQIEKRGIQNLSFSKDNAVHI